MALLLRFSGFVDGVSRRLGAVCDYLILIVCFISAGNAMMRYAISYSSNSYLEIQWYLFGAVVLLGAACTLLKNEHVRVDVVYSLLSDRNKLIVDTCGIIIFLLPVTSYLIYLSWPFFLKSFVNGEVSNNAGGLTLWPAKLLLPAGFFFLWLQALSELIKRIAALRGVIQLETKYEKPIQ